MIQGLLKFLSASPLLLVSVGLILALFGGSFSRMNPNSTPGIAIMDAELTDLTRAASDYCELTGEFPANEKDLVDFIESFMAKSGSERWEALLKEDLVDPWDTPYRYHFPGIQNPEEPEIISAGPDRLFGTVDDLSNQD